MIAKPRNTMTYALSPSVEDESALRETLVAYRAAMVILDGTKGANVVALHEEAYEEIREKTGLPARLVTLALRDHGRRVAGEPIEDFPVDSKLFSIKGPDTISVATVIGRAVVPYSVAGYRGGWGDFAEGRVVFGPKGISIEIAVDASTKPLQEEHPMTESILSRLGRVIAGTAHGAIDAMEKSSPVAVAEQALRDIESVIEDAVSAVGRARAQEHRIKSKISEIGDELADLDGKIVSGVAAGRDDLVKPAIGLQIDLEAQRSALEKALAEAKGEIDEAGEALLAARAARADVASRVADLRKSSASAATGGDASPSVRNDNRLARALGAVQRVTGVTPRPGTAAAEVEELGRLQREGAIEERLARIKEGGRT